ncbi:MAG: isoaspartyl peptidase/L-asparaginase [Desulfurococcales archaeon]|nr:isoaspartyl peptidase/L-asparaginase [Desulfurococcales archaeon]
MSGLQIVLKHCTLTTPVAIVHGGAGTWKAAPIEVWEVLDKAVMIGVENSSKSALEGAVLSVEKLEDTCLLNAGRGSVLDYYGNISMDAGLMDGVSRKYGAVANVHYPLHPIRLAYIIMNQTAHNFLAGMEADLFASQLGLTRHPGPCENRINQWVESRSKPLRPHLEANRKWLESDTVGGIVSDGNLVAVGVSTGGISLKMPGRVGDSPLIGGGFYSTGKVGVIATGIGELISRYLLSYRLALAFEEGGYSAVSKVFNEFTDKYGYGTAGFILGSNKGDVITGYNTEFMPWKACDKERCIGNYVKS